MIQLFHQWYQSVLTSNLLFYPTLPSNFVHETYVMANQNEETPPYNFISQLKD